MERWSIGILKRSDALPPSLHHSIFPIFHYFASPPLNIFFIKPCMSS